MSPLLKVEFKAVPFSPSRYDEPEDSALPELAGTLAGRSDRPALICFVDGRGKASRSLLARFEPSHKDVCLIARHYFRTLLVDVSRIPGQAPAVVIVSPDGKVLDHVDGKSVCRTRLLEAMGKAFPPEVRLALLLKEWDVLLQDLAGLDRQKEVLDHKKWEQSLGGRPTLGRKIAALQRRLSAEEAGMRKRQTALCGKVRLLAGARKP